MLRWTRDLVRDELRSAAQTIRSLPARGCFPDKPRAHWPEVRNISIWELYNGMTGAEIAERQRDINLEKTRTSPTPEQITASDAIIWALYAVPTRDRKVLWARAHGYSWRKIAKFDGRSHEWLRQVADQHWTDLAINLNAVDRPDKIW